MVETMLAQTAGNLKHSAAGMWEFMGGDASELRESADDNQIFAGTRKGTSGAIMRGAGDFVGTMAGNPAGKVGWALGTVRGLANGYSQTLAETGDREEAKRTVLKEAPWMALYMVSGQMGAKAGRLLLPKNAGPLLKSVAAFGGAQVSSVSTGMVRAIVEGQQYGLQQLTADTLFAVYHAKGSYSGEINAAARETARRELINRGYSQEQISAPFEMGARTPSDILRTSTQPRPSPVEVSGTAGSPQMGMQPSKQARLPQGQQTVAAKAPATNQAQPQGSQSKQQNGLRAKKGNTTALGVKRNNRKDWRETKDLWDQLGYGEILSDKNRKLIAKGRRPRVDDHWISIFPEDLRFKGEGISVHHVKRLPLTTVLPFSRHMEAHMPGGTRNNPGNIGSQAPLEYIGKKKK